MRLLSYQNTFFNVFQGHLISPFLSFERFEKQKERSTPVLYFSSSDPNPNSNVRISVIRDHRCIFHGDHVVGYNQYIKRFWPAVFKNIYRLQYLCTMFVPLIRIAAIKAIRRKIKSLDPVTKNTNFFICKEPPLSCHFASFEWTPPKFEFRMWKCFGMTGQWSLCIFKEQMWDGSVNIAFECTHHAWNKYVQNKSVQSEFTPILKTLAQRRATYISPGISRRQAIDPIDTEDLEYSVTYEERCMDKRMANTKVHRSEKARAIGTTDIVFNDTVALNQIPKNPVEDNRIYYFPEVKKDNEKLGSHFKRAVIEVDEEEDGSGADEDGGNVDDAFEIDV